MSETAVVNSQGMRKWLELLVYPAALSLLVILICRLNFNSFFLLDDTVNALLPNLLMMGKAYLNGEIPFIMPGQWVGDNNLVNLHSPLFHPQLILSSLGLALGASAQSVACTNAFLNLFVLSLSTLALCRLLQVRLSYRLATCAFVCIQPVLLYFFLESWTALAMSLAYCAAALCSFLYLRVRLSLSSYLLNFICVLLLCLCVVPYGITVYALIITVFFLTDFINAAPKTAFLKASLPLFAASLCAFICTLPIFIEYAHLSGFLSGQGAVSNLSADGGLPWSALMMSFFPAFYDFFLMPGEGLHLVPYALGFTTPLLLVVLFLPYRSLKSQYLTPLLLSAVLILLLCLTPAQFGLLRWPIRFVPFLSLLVGLCVAALLERAPSYAQISGIYYALCLLALLLSLMHSAGADERLVLMQLASCVLLALIPFILRQHERLKTALLQGSVFACLGLFLMGAVRAPSGTSMVPEEINKDCIGNGDGYFISLTGPRTPPSQPADLYASQFAFYGIDTVSGYSPRGHQALSRLIPYAGSQVIFRPQEVLTHLLQDAGHGVCRAELMRISDLALLKPQLSEFKPALLRCGFATGTYYGEIFYLQRDKAKTASWQQHPPLALQRSDLSFEVLTHRSNHDVVLIPPHGEELNLIFPRVFWDGYQAFLQGEQLEVGSDSSGAQVEVRLPANAHGELELVYFPRTFRWSWYLTLLGFLIMAGSGILMYRKQAGAEDQ